MEIHDKVCEALGVDDLAFKYSTQPGGEPVAGQPQGWAIEIERPIGRGFLKLGLDSVQNVNRMVMEYSWPPSREHVSQDLDSVYEATFRALGGGWQKILAEVRIRGQVQSQGDSAAAYLLDRVLRFSPAALAALESQPNFASVGFETAAGDPLPEDPLHQPKREVKVEVLREDPRSLYVEVMSQWPQLAQAPGNTVEIDMRRIRPLDSPPSGYLQNAMQFVNEQVVPLFIPSPEKGAAQ